MTQNPEVEDLLKQVAAPRGCKGRNIKNPDAAKYVAGLIALWESREEESWTPNWKLASQHLLTYWLLDFPARGLSAHVKGECRCRKPTIQ